LKISRALISVYHKEGLEPVLEQLSKMNVQLISTGGTKKYIEEKGYECMAVEELTQYPSMLGGRVKTLHPAIFGGILARRPEDQTEMDQYDLRAIDLVIVDLYPFEKYLEANSSHQELIEKIDIGGISLIRAAAKNYSSVTVVPSVKEYDALVSALKADKVDEGFRRKMASRAFSISSQYDQLIASYLGEGERKELRYGENPHQKAVFHGRLDELFTQLHGKELSFNNLVDIESAMELIYEFKDDNPTFVVIKHTNPCGVATAENLLDAWTRALAGDPVSAFGGIIVCNRPIDKEVAEELNKLFIEVLIAPGFSDEALSILKSKKNRILLDLKKYYRSSKKYKSCLNGEIEQDADLLTEKAFDLESVTKKKASETEISDMIFANKIVKYTKSNAIVLVKKNQLVGIGVGQTSRIDALKQAIHKAASFDLSVKGAVMASDAFFPFADSVETAKEAGIEAVIQPGGSVKDKDSIEFCDQNGMSMVFTGNRHFKH